MLARLYYQDSIVDGETMSGANQKKAARYFIINEIISDYISKWLFFVIDKNGTI